MTTRPSLTLPIDAVTPQLVSVLRDSSCAVVVAPTGAGKTTRVPPALLDAGLSEGQRVIMLEPRRVAARAAARRIAEERGVKLGGEVGYQIRFEKVAGPDTRILIVTEGILVRMLQDDPFLEGVGVLVFDEFHERSLNVDLALAMSRRVQEDARPDLKIVVMSATLEAEPVARYLHDCPVVVSEGRLFPVDVRYLERPSSRRAHELAVEGVRRALVSAQGDVLVFLPGVGEIRRAQEALSAEVGADVALMTLYGDMPSEAQDAVLRPTSRRKVVLATNVAETSLTIPGIAVVVDTGLAKVMRYDPARGFNRLELRRVSQASADQRAGRAGRQGPGVCLRMWTEREHRLLEAFEEPEVRRVELAGPSLELMAWGEPSLSDFPWFEAPRAEGLSQAKTLLRMLGAIDGRGVTALGREMVRWPLHPRLSRLMIEAWRLGHGEDGAWLAALQAERDPFLRDASPTAGLSADSDTLERLARVRAAASGGASGGLHRGGVATIARVARQQRAIARRVLGEGPARKAVGRGEALGRALLAGFPDRLARRRASGDPRALMVGGRGVRLMPQSAVRRAELFVCVTLDARPSREGPEARVREASGVKASWLSAEHLSKEVVVRFDEARGRVMAFEQRRYEDLVLEERNTSAPPAGEAARLLTEAVMGYEDPEKRAGLDARGPAELLTRLRCLASWRPELSLPTFEGEGLSELLLAGAQGRRSLDELRRAPWKSLVLGHLSWPQRQALDREAPERLQLRGGRAVRLQYEVGAPPVLALRIQQAFGLTDTPRVGGGRVAVLMHLLAPNMRPQQITQDLRSFWDNTYPEVRKELRQRYPKHAWPEDPWRFEN